jgi:hypothetical protein
LHYVFTRCSEIGKFYKHFHQREGQKNQWRAAPERVTIGRQITKIFGRSNPVLQGFSQQMTARIFLFRHKITDTRYEI